MGATPTSPRRGEDVAPMILPWTSSPTSPSFPPLIEFSLRICSVFVEGRGQAANLQRMESERGALLFCSGIDFAAGHRVHTPPFISILAFLPQIFHLPAKESTLRASVWTSRCPKASKSIWRRSGRTAERSFAKSNPRCPFPAPWSGLCYSVALQTFPHHKVARKRDPPGALSTGMDALPRVRGGWETPCAVRLSAAPWTWACGAARCRTPGSEARPSDQASHNFLFSRPPSVRARLKATPPFPYDCRQRNRAQIGNCTFVLRPVWHFMAKTPEAEAPCVVYDGESLVFSDGLRARNFHDFARDPLDQSPQS